MVSIITSQQEIHGFKQLTEGFLCHVGFLLTPSSRSQKTCRLDQPTTLNFPIGVNVSLNSYSSLKCHILNFATKPFQYVCNLLLRSVFSHAKHNTGHAKLLCSMIDDKQSCRKKCMKCDTDPSWDAAPHLSTLIMKCQKPLSCIDSCPHTIDATRMHKRIDKRTRASW